MLFNLKRPCAECPFRNDRSGYLRRSRAKQLVNEVIQGNCTFSCHKTINGVAHDESHCAGALILMKHEDSLYENHAIRMAARLGIFKEEDLDLSSPVFGDSEDFIDNMS